MEEVQRLDWLMQLPVSRRGRRARRGRRRRRGHSRGDQTTQQHWRSRTIPGSFHHSFHHSRAISGDVPLLLSCLLPWWCPFLPTCSPHHLRVASARLGELGADPIT